MEITKFVTAVMEMKRMPAGALLPPSPTYSLRALRGATFKRANKQLPLAMNILPNGGKEFGFAMSRTVWAICNEFSINMVG